MKKLFALLVVVMLSAAALVPTTAEAGWVSGGVAGPASNLGDVIADTGPLLAISGAFTVVIDGNGTNGEFEIVVRNAADNADVTNHHIWYSPLEHYSQTFPVTLSLNQRLIVRVATYPAGYFQASILW
jgi:hypothetical protein